MSVVVAAGTLRNSVSCEECWRQLSVDTLLVCHGACGCPLPICSKCYKLHAKRKQFLACSGCGECVFIARPIQSFVEYVELAKSFFQKNKPTVQSQKSYSLCKQCLKPTNVWARHLLCRKTIGKTNLCYTCAINGKTHCSDCECEIDEKQVSPASYFIEI